MSYNIKGIYTSSSESSMLTLYELVRPERPDLKRWLDNTVLIMDPMVNPDGRERYINWYNQMRSEERRVGKERGCAGGRLRQKASREEAMSQSAREAAR